MYRIIIFSLIGAFFISCESTGIGNEGDSKVYQVSGNVLFEDNPVADANIMLISSETDTLFSTSDNNGFYEFTTVENGVYILKANKDRYVEFVDPNITVDGNLTEIDANLRSLSYPDSLVSSIKVVNADSLIGNFKLALNSSADFDMESDLGTDSAQISNMTFRMSRKIEKGDVVEITGIGDIRTVEDSEGRARALVGIKIFESLQEGYSGEEAEFLHFFDSRETQTIISPSSGRYVYIYVGGTGAFNWDGSFFKLYTVLGK